MGDIFIGIGSNLNNPKQQVLDAIRHINSIQGVDVSSQSSLFKTCLLYTSPSPRDQRGSRMPSSA